jgi:hypothetical protein
MLVSLAKQGQTVQPRVQLAISHAALLPIVAFLHHYHAHYFQPELEQGQSGCLEMLLFHKFHRHSPSQDHTPATVRLMDEGISCGKYIMGSVDVSYSIT